ncbi:Metalloenzyme, LuxS/M16 peptidase-like protein [Blyttiomyces helicus]|uniref:Cytochrome b-c1 complex subunit 2, mitochondrial n=1 Tax=Blyttiomyces helicus TaxID=388810 RepID=A0A4P9W9V7_9FUNG|nr:Metalloenzyme, LuxS/M16 peptidase-like protein [Blyttiomyces helicus]|eukprot:RKO89351.1 Metalloenzyme, LuxS/M16 peptidase-like protein [Blyttiomyces helicus]
MYPRSSVLRSAVRSYASLAREQPLVAAKAHKTVSKTSAGVKVATYDEGGPASSLAVVLKAGSRYESPDAPGAAHLLKTSLVRAVPGDNIVRTILEAELRGNSLYTSVGREQLTIGSEFLRDDLVDAVPSLLSHVFNSSFHAYEFLDARAKAIEESTASLADPRTKVIEALHHIAFRSGLGNSVLASPAAAKALKRAHLQEFASKLFTSDRIAVVGTGIAHEDLTALVESSLASLTLSAGTAATAASKYFGGETRFDAGPAAPAHYAVAFPSASFASADYAASLVLRAYLDSSSRVKWGSPSGVTGLLSSAASADVTVSSLAASYSDAGLIGFYLTGPSAHIGGVASKALKTVKTAGAGFTAEHLARAKKAAIVDAEADFSRETKLQDVARSVLTNGTFSTSEELAAAVNKVTVADVQKLLTGISVSKPSIVALGNLSQLPFADQL